MNPLILLHSLQGHDDKWIVEGLDVKRKIVSIFNHNRIHLKGKFCYSPQMSIGWLYVVTSVIPLALKGILPIRIIPIGKIL